VALSVAAWLVKTFQYAITIPQKLAKRKIGTGDKPCDFWDHALPMKVCTSTLDRVSHSGVNDGFRPARQDQGWPSLFEGLMPRREKARVAALFRVISLDGLAAQFQDCTNREWRTIPHTAEPVLDWESQACRSSIGSSSSAGNAKWT
jgi:hypothetical protein